MERNRSVTAETTQPAEGNCFADGIVVIKTVLADYELEQRQFIGLQNILRLVEQSLPGAVSNGDLARNCAGKEAVSFGGI